jgi:deoxycytidylate deaminase
MKDGTLGMAKPCKICLNKIKEYGIKKVFYTNENGEIIMEYTSEMETEHKSKAEKSFFI